MQFHKPKGKSVKKLMAILFCFALAVGAADARTLYVNARRPNNNGNGLRPATAKKTIQAAINIAQNGDTILVYPGWYAPIQTNNKKISVKSVKGASKTGITETNNPCAFTLASLGRRTWLTGFLVDGRNVHPSTTGVQGGFLKACCLQRIIGSFTGEPIIGDAVLTGCVIRNNSEGFIRGSVLNRCKITGNCGGDFEIAHSRLANCLVTGYQGFGPLCSEAVFVNCTIAQNRTWHWSGGNPLFSRESKFYNCILRNNFSQARTEEGGQCVYGRLVLHNVDPGNVYYRTYGNNRDPKFANPAKGDYRLQWGSPCINQGRLTPTLKKLVGTKALAGRRRVHGKAIDMGCYEY